MEVMIYRSDSINKKLNRSETYTMPYVDTDVNESYGHPGDIEANIINILDDIEYQTVLGIGGAFSDSAANAWKNMPENMQKRLIEAYFDREHGIGYNFGRLSIASCDFSTEDYTYVEDGDITLDSFDISHDKKAVFPMVKAAKEYTDLVLLASPWSPPAYMKTNDTREYGGHLKKEYYPIWAKYFAKYIAACRAENIDIWGVTLQNEPRHTQMWESCLYSVEEEIEFLGHLGKALSETEVKILCYDHCRERVYERAKKLYESENGKYCDGIAHHWYSGDHFGELKAFYERYPEKYNIASEGCCAIVGEGIRQEKDLEFAEHYAHDILGCFRNGLSAYCDWNLTLDEKNGPYHNRTGRGCSAEAPVYCNKQTGELVFRSSYYYIGQVSKFVKRGAKVVHSSSYTESLDYCAFKNPDGEVILTVMNRRDNKFDLIVRLDGHIHKTDIPAHSIATFVINK